MNSVVLFHQGGAPLLLIQTVHDSDGRVVGGWVENGGWYYRVDGDTAGSCSGPKSPFVHTWPRPTEAEEDFVTVPHTMRDDYNEIIQWAEVQRGR